MRTFLILLSCLVVTSTAWAEESARANSLTAKEIADGWILLFDGETTFGWNLEGANKVEDGHLLLGGEKACQAKTSVEFGCCELTFEYRLAEQHDASLQIRQEVTRLPMTFERGSWNLARITVAPSKISIRLGTLSEEMKEISWPDADKHTYPILLSVSEGSKLAVRNIKIRPNDLKPLFNGKDLSGWKEHPGKKTKFTVTKEGWLHLQDGPGDLQTEGQWDNFILQAECKTNGDKLNSGIFFRCRPGEYQQGYEAQIHNGFTPKSEKEYGIDEYDPKTNKLIDTRKVKYTAQDYGTGGIYRRIPARREVAKDKEWFTMTIVAEGRHIATWVNGLQVVDWTDNRPEKDNARNGCRLQKGPISLQGHDPTTDLNFRNLRIAELPKK
jgi:hypothetical protein